MAEFFSFFFPMKISRTIIIRRYGHMPSHRRGGGGARLVFSAPARPLPDSDAGWEASYLSPHRRLGCCNGHIHDPQISLRILPPPEGWKRKKISPRILRNQYKLSLSLSLSVSPDDSSSSVSGITRSELEDPPLLVRYGRPEKWLGA